MKAGYFRKMMTVGLTLSFGMAAAVQAQTIKIGVIAPLTGGGAPWGLATAEGAKIAAAEVNAAGGLDVGGKKDKVEVIAYDDQYKAANAVAAYSRLTQQDGVKYVIIMSSAGSLALKQNIEDDKVIGLSSAFSAKVIDANSHYMFRLFSTPRDYLNSVIKWIAGAYTQRRIYLINPNDATGWDQTDQSTRFFKANGFDVIGKDLYERSVQDFQPIFTKAIAANPGIIDLGSSSPATAGLMVRQARNLGYKGLIVKTGGAGPEAIVAAAGKKASEGVVNVLYADPNNKGYQKLEQAYKKDTGHEPNDIIVSYYDATNILLRAISLAGDANDTTKVAASFAKALPMKSVQGDMITLGGKATSGVNHQFMTNMYIGVIKNGVPVVVGKVQ